MTHLPPTLAFPSYLGSATLAAGSRAQEQVGHLYKDSTIYFTTSRFRLGSHQACQDKSSTHYARGTPSPNKGSDCS